MVSKITQDIQTDVYLRDNYSIVFSIAQDEVLRIDKGGEFYVNGNLVETDQEVYYAFKEWLEHAVEEI